MKQLKWLCRLSLLAVLAALLLSQGSVLSAPRALQSGVLPPHLAAGHSVYLPIVFAQYDPSCPHPDAPTLSPIDNADRDGNYTVRWSSVGGATHYELEECVGSDCTTAQVTGTSQAFAGKADGTYRYRVRAVNACGNSIWSAAVSVTVGGCALPTAPVLEPIDNADRDGSYTVRWSSVSGATRYELQECVDSSCTTYQVSDPLKSFTGKDDGTYTYRVRAINACGEGPWSDAEQTEVCALLPAPTLYSIANSDGDGNYRVSWSYVGGALFYELQQDDNETFASPEQAYFGTSTSTLISSQPDGTFYYRVRALNVCGKGPWSDTKQVVVCARPFSPTLSEIDNADRDGNYTVRWSSVPGATGYVLEEDDHSGFTSPKQVYSGPNTSHAFSGKPEGDYWYRVRAVNPCGESSWSSSKRTEVCNPPSSPSMREIDNADRDGNYTVRWSSVSGASSYELEECKGSSCQTYQVTGTSRSFTGKGDGTYRYRVRAVNDCGRSGWSAQVSTVVCGAPAAPQLNAIENSDGNGSYTVSWSSVSGASSYELQEDDNEAFSSPTRVHLGPATSKAFSGKSRGTYWYRVRAIGDCGTSTWSAKRSVRVEGGATVTVRNNCPCRATFSGLGATFSVPSSGSWTGTRTPGTYTIHVSGSCFLDFSQSVTIQSGGNTLTLNCYGSAGCTSAAP